MGELIISIICLAVGAIAVYYLFFCYKRYSLISKTETTNISWLQDGFYEIKGKIVALSEQLISPFSQKPCVYYEFKVEQKKSSGNNTHYVSIIDDKKFQKFGVDDGTGMAVIDLLNADIMIKTDKTDSSGTFDHADENQLRVLNKYNQSNKGLLFEKSLRYTEKYLEAGDEIYVLGEVQGREQSKPLFNKGKLPLFVSDKTENELLKYYKLRTIFSAVAILIVAALAFFLWKDQIWAMF